MESRRSFRGAHNHHHSTLHTRHLAANCWPLDSKMVVLENILAIILLGQIVRKAGLLEEPADDFALLITDKLGEGQMAPILSLQSSRIYCSGRSPYGLEDITTVKWTLDDQ